MRLRKSGPGRIRTCDARFRKPTLYPLSYEASIRALAPGVGARRLVAGVYPPLEVRPATLCK